MILVRKVGTEVHRLLRLHLGYRPHFTHASQAHIVSLWCCNGMSVFGLCDDEMVFYVILYGLHLTSNEVGRSASLDVDAGNKSMRCIGKRVQPPPSVHAHHHHTSPYWRADDTRQSRTEPSPDKTYIEFCSGHSEI